MFEARSWFLKLKLIFTLPKLLSFSIGYRKTYILLFFSSSMFDCGYYNLIINVFKKVKNKLMFEKVKKRKVQKDHSTVNKLTNKIVGKLNENQLY